MADALSRNDVNSFSHIFPQVAPMEVPAVLFEVVVGENPDWSLPHWIELFRCSLSGLSPHTVGTYRSGIRQYFTFCLRLHLQLQISHCVALCLACIPNASLILSVCILALCIFFRFMQEAQTLALGHSPVALCVHAVGCLSPGPVIPLSSQSLLTF